MSSSMAQFRIDDELKSQATLIYERLGLDFSTAMRIFVKRTVMANGLPFSMVLNEEPADAKQFAGIMEKLSESAEKNGSSDMTLDEINSEISAYRKEKTSRI